MLLTYQYFSFESVHGEAMLKMGWVVKKWIVSFSRLPNDLMLNHWLNKKNNLIVIRFRFRGAEKVNKPCTFCVLKGIFVSLGNEQKIGECHAIAYGIFRWWCKYEVREFAHFVRFSFRCEGVLEAVKNTWKSKIIWVVYIIFRHARR